MSEVDNYNSVAQEADGTYINGTIRPGRCIRSHNVQPALLEMKKVNTSLHWIVALYLALSTICVTVNKLYGKSSNVDIVIPGAKDSDGAELLAESNSEIAQTKGGGSEICDIG